MGKLDQIAAEITAAVINERYAPTGSELRIRFSLRDHQVQEVKQRVRKMVYEKTGLMWGWRRSTNRYVIVPRNSHPEMAREVHEAYVKSWASGGKDANVMARAMVSSGYLTPAQGEAIIRNNEDARSLIVDTLNV